MRKRRPFWLLLVMVALPALLAWMSHRQLQPVPNLDWGARDLFTVAGRPAPLHPDLVFVGITKSDYSDTFFPEDRGRSEVMEELCQPYPWKRTVWADLLDRLAAAGARLVAFDILFLAEKPEDGAFQSALERHRDRVVLAWNINLEGRAQWEAPPPSVWTSREAESIYDPVLGFVNIWPDPWDGVFRRARFRITESQLWGLVTAEGEASVSSDTFVESLPARMLRKLGKSSLIPSGSEPVLFRYASPPGWRLRPIPIGDLYDPKLWEREYGKGAFFKDKIVVVGPAANFLHDLHRTPFPGEPMLGPEVHLQVLNAALNQEFLQSTPPWADLLAIGLMGALGVASGMIRSALLRQLLLVGATLAWWIAGFLLHQAGAPVPALVTPVVALNLNGWVILAYDYGRERHERRRARATLERYLSREVAREVLDRQPGFLTTLQGELKPVTVLFCDIRNFTRMTEESDPRELVRQLNEYFEAMVEAITGNRGRIDKFIGDAIMAEWGGIVSSGAREDAVLAVRTALAMRRALPTLNARWRTEGKREFSIGIGLNQGEAVVGNLGTERKMEISAIGDAVNLASRLEGLTKKYHADILVGESVARLAWDAFAWRTVDFLVVKGKSRPVDTFAVLEERGAGSGSPPHWLIRYEEGVRLYRTGEFLQAMHAFEEAMEENPGDFLCAEYLDRCQVLARNPVPENWTGVFIHTEK